MGSSEKRRGGAGGSGSSSAPRGAAAASSPSPAAPSGNAPPAAVISLPPRAALTGASSSPPPPSPDDRAPAGPSPSTSSSAPSPARRDSAAGAGGGGGSSAASAAAAAAAAASASAAASAAQQQVRERDQRIASLERELDVMEAEFARELDRLAAAEAEAAAFWQGRHGAAAQQLARADAELRLARAEAEARAAERGPLLEALEAARREARARADEARMLRAQARGLKEWVSTSTRAAGGQQASDESVGADMARLGNGLQNWVIVHFRRARFDLSRATEETVRELDDLVPMYEELAQTAKVHLLQSIVSRILMETVFDAYFVGLSPEQASQLAQAEDLLLSLAGPGEAVNQWRAVTLAILKREAAGKMEAQMARVVDDVVARVNRLLDAVTTTTTTTTTANNNDAAAAAAGPTAEARDQALRALVRGAAELSRTLAAQKAVFEVAMPAVGPHPHPHPDRHDDEVLLFDPATMEDLGGEDEESLVRRAVCCVAFPGIVKRGDENGGHLQFRNVIAKARVLCAPE